MAKNRMFLHPFSFEGRIRRLEYGISLILMTCYISIVVPIIHCIIIILGLEEILMDDALTRLVVLFLLCLPICWFMLAQCAKRCHDRGHSGWYQFIPFYGFWMLFAEGDISFNHYGKPPK